MTASEVAFHILFTACRSIVWSMIPGMAQVGMLVLIFHSAGIARSNTQNVTELTRTVRRAALRAGSGLRSPGMLMRSVLMAVTSRSGKGTTFISAS